MANIVNPNLPADLPTDWTTSQYVSPNGSEVSLSQQHGYNYLMEQVNAAQTAVNTLAEQAQEAVSGLESGALTAAAIRSGTTVAITGPEDAVTVTFLAPADWTEGDSYTYNGTPITVTDLNGSPVTDGWKQGAVLTFQISGGVAYFVGGASGSFLPLSGGTMTGPAVGASGDDGEAQFRNISYGTTDLTPGVSDLPSGEMYLYLDPEETGDPDGLLPPGGTNGQILMKSGSQNYLAEWSSAIPAAEVLQIANQFTLYGVRKNKYDFGFYVLQLKLSNLEIAKEVKLDDKIDSNTPFPGMETIGTICTNDRVFKVNIGPADGSIWIRSINSDSPTTISGKFSIVYCR